VETSGWMCDVFRRNGLSFVTFDIRVDGLAELPPSDAYIRCGKADKCVADNSVFDEHPRPFHCTGAMANAVADLARRYRELHPSQRLRVLDLSLPRGGLMEVNPQTGQWLPPHHWHRVGESVDIGQWVVNDSGVGVHPNVIEFTEELKDLAKHVHPAIYRVVESGGEIHFQLTGGLQQ
jgi:hypothetical protein